MIPNRHSSSNSYRYGFNGKENDNEVKGEGNSLHYEFREFDTRVGRYSTIDPHSKLYPWQSSYVYHRNNPINLIDYLGLGDPPGSDPPSARDTPLNVVGIKAHQAFSIELETVLERNFNTTEVLQNRKRPDVIDEDKNIVWELKPKSWMPVGNAKAKLNQATRQTDGYVNQLNIERPEFFTKGSNNPSDAPSFYVPQASDGDYLYKYFCPDPSTGIIYYEAIKIKKPDNPGLPIAGQKETGKPSSKSTPNQKPVIQLVPQNEIPRAAYNMPQLNPEAVKTGVTIGVGAIIIATIIEYWPLLLLL